MKVYVITKARPLQPEIYVTVKATRKQAEKVIRAMYPHAKKDEWSGGYDCRDANGNTLLMFIHEEVLEGIK